MTLITKPIESSSPILHLPGADREALFLLTNLPGELLLLILRELNHRDLATLSLVSRDIRLLVNDDKLWKHLFARAYPFNQVGANIGSYRVAYQKEHRFRCNLAHGRYTERLFEEEMSGGTSKLMLRGKTLYSQDAAGIKAWDLETGTFTKKFPLSESGHSDLVGDTLFQGDYGGQIRSWSISNHDPVTPFAEHGPIVLSLLGADGVLYSGATDFTIKAWHISTRTCLRTFVGHASSVTALAVSGKTLYSGSLDKTIRAWDIEDGTCKATFTGHTDAVNALCIFNGVLYSGSSDWTVKAWDLETAKCLHTFEGHTGQMINSLVIEDGLLYISAYPEQICVWDLQTKRLVHDFKKGNSAADAILVSEGVLYSAPMINRKFQLRAWDFNATK